MSVGLWGVLWCEQGFSFLQAIHIRYCVTFPFTPLQLGLWVSGRLAEQPAVPEDLGVVVLLFFIFRGVKWDLVRGALGVVGLYFPFK